MNALCENARTPYLEIARDYGVSGAAVHQRIQRLLASKVIVGSHCELDPSTIGFNVVAYVGLCAKPGTDINELIEAVKDIVTGKYDLIVKLHARSNGDILKIITERMRALPLASTETMVSFRECFKRPLPIEDEK